jgi:hypothetical protein
MLSLALFKTWTSDDFEQFSHLDDNNTFDCIFPLAPDSVRTTFLSTTAMLFFRFY